MRNHGDIVINLRFSRRGLLRIARIAVIAAAIAAPMLVIASTVTLPPLFVANTPIVANDVNAVHVALADAVNDNAARACTVMDDGAGTVTINCGLGGSADIPYTLRDLIRAQSA